jgi:hypothetical protein
VLIVVALAHPKQNGLLAALRRGARFALGPMGDAPSAPDGHLGAALGLALLPGRAVAAAQAALLHVLGAARVTALLPLGPVGDAQPPLHDAVGAALDGALAPDAVPAGASPARRAPVMAGLLRGAAGGALGAVGARLWGGGGA